MLVADEERELLAEVVAVVREHVVVLLAIEGNPLLHKEIPYYRRKSLLSKEILHYNKKSLTIEVSTS